MSDHHLKVLILMAACVSASLVVGCGKGTAAVADSGAELACTVVPPLECPDPAPRYQDVESIFSQRCVDCHFGAEEGPWPLTEYRQVAAWAELVRADLLNCSMPPADAGGAAMTDQERIAILTWILCGSRE
ncbi:MAG: hypothetical protein ABIS92_17180 [Polyangia bacterium]